MTYADCACTRSSNESRTPTATTSRPSDSRSRCSSAAPTADCYGPGCRRSATRYQSTPRYAATSTDSTKRSPTTSPTSTSPPDTCLLSAGFAGSSLLVRRVTAHVAVVVTGHSTVRTASEVVAWPEGPERSRRGTCAALSPSRDGCRTAIGRALRRAAVVVRVPQCGNCYGTDCRQRGDAPRMNFFITPP